MQEGAEWTAERQGKGQNDNRGAQHVLPKGCILSSEWHLSFLSILDQRVCLVVEGGTAISLQCWSGEPSSNRLDHSDGGRELS